MEYSKLDNIPKYLTILPVKIIPSGGGGVYPKELIQGKFGKLTIGSILLFHP